MKVDTPMIFWHEREPVLSIDVHPSGFIATAGADKKVRVSTVRAPRMPVYACSLFVICLMHSQWAVSNLIASLAWNSCVEYIYEILSALCVSVYLRCVCVCVVCVALPFVVRAARTYTCMRASPHSYAQSSKRAKKHG